MKNLLLSCFMLFSAKANATAASPKGTHLCLMSMFSSAVNNSVTTSLFVHEYIYKYHMYLCYSRG